MHKYVFRRVPWKILMRIKSLGTQLISWMSLIFLDCHHKYEQNELRYHFDAKFDPKTWTLQWDTLYRNLSLTKNYLFNKIYMSCQWYERNDYDSKIPIHTKKDDFQFILKIIQGTVRISCVMSMHKSQGQTFTKCSIMLPNSVFTHKQLYVGLSRCWELNNMSIYVMQDEYSHLPNDKFYTTNVDYPEVLG